MFVIHNPFALRSWLLLSQGNSENLKRGFYLLSVNFVNMSMFLAIAMAVSSFEKAWAFIFMMPEEWSVARRKRLLRTGLVLRRNECVAERRMMTIENQWGYQSKEWIACELCG
jgi:hypothetical protein